MSRPLGEMDKGQRFEIEDVDDETLKAKLLRLGFMDGSVECRRKLRNGPVVISRNGTELALGDSHAQKVTVASGSD
ncbi:MAG: ferrous iron transport protein A [Candidatus Nanohaloarchaea archaeon]